MAKKISWTNQAKADVRSICRETALGLLHGIARFLDTERGDIKQLQGITPPEFRLRLGDYRMRYRDHGDWIEVLRIVNRREAYRD
jgi:hypothetical protein